MLLPAGLRQRDQTKKSPTGPLDREALLQYLEQQALEVKERDDLVPFTGEKKGMETLTSTPPRTQIVASHMSPLQLPSHLPAPSCPGTWLPTSACQLALFSSCKRPRGPRSPELVEDAGFTVAPSDLALHLLEKERNLEARVLGEMTCT